MTDVFYFKTEIWVPLYTGVKAESLQEFYEALLSVPNGSLLYHLYINLFNYHNLPTMYTNSFAYWFQHIGCDALAEKISSIDPTRYRDLEALRERLIEILSEHKEDCAKRQASPFYFMDIYREVIDTGEHATSLEELIKGIEKSSIYSLFHHLITSKIDNKRVINDYSQWLMSMGYPKKAELIEALDLYALNLYEVKSLILEILKDDKT